MNGVPMLTKSSFNIDGHGLTLAAFAWVPCVAARRIFTITLFLGDCQSSTLFSKTRCFWDVVF